MYPIVFNVLPFEHLCHVVKKELKRFTCDLYFAITDALGQLKLSIIFICDT